MKRPNLVVVCLDTLRCDMIRHVGVDWMRTPNIDRLAKQSVIFENCYAEGLPTQQVRRAFFTGMRSFPWRFDMDVSGLWPTLRGWHRIPPEQPTMAEILLDEGYTSALIGDTPHMFRAGNFTRGFTCFDWIRGQESDNYKTGPLSAIDLAKHFKPGAAATQPMRMLAQYLLNVKDRKVEDDYFCAQVFAKSAQWLEENLDGQPLFLWVDSFDPHEPWDPPRQYADLYCPDYQGPELIQVQADKGLTAKEKERIKALYCGEVTFVDRCLGRLLDKIESLGLKENTIIMFVTDHGTELFDHGGLHKGGQKLFSYITRQAWFIYHPAHELRDRRVKAFVQDHDLFPTALRLLGVRHGPVDGIDVWPLATGEADAVRDHVITGYGDFASVRDAEWNFQVAFEAQDPKARLYHLASDPQEKKNVAAAHPEAVRKQQERLEALLGQRLPAQLPDKTHPTEGPYVKRFENLVKAGKIKLPQEASRGS